MNTTICVTNSFSLFCLFCLGLLLLILFRGVLFETKKEMYAESGLMFQSFSPEFDDFCYSYKLGSVVQNSTISDHDLGGETDLFEAAEPVIDQPLTTLDPMTIITCGEDKYSPQELNLTDIESLQNEEFLSNVFHEYKDILEKETETSPLSEVLNYKFTVKTDDSFIVKENLHPPGHIQKSVSSDCLSSTDWIHGAQVTPNFLNITEEDFENVYGMRRAFSEGDMKTLANGNGSQRNSSLGLPQLMSEYPNEDRWQKLSRYRNKKTKRNFGRKIKYACRKALADNQPRIRGRFAKTEESEVLGK